MQPFKRTLIELFDGKKRYLVPLYQRKYAWRVDPQLTLLWEDVELAALQIKEDRRSSTPHFMGALVIAQIKTFGKQVQAFEVIDGQQRLTTIQLLLIAFRDVALKYESDYADEVKKYLLNDGVMETPQIERFKLWPTLTDRATFVKHVDTNTDTSGQEYDNYSYADDEKLSDFAYSFFVEKITDYVVDEDTFIPLQMEHLFEALKDSLAVVSIELEGGDDPQTIFETLNSRGVPLSQSDLMRNFIFQRAKGDGLVNASLPIDDMYKKYWLPLDRDFWATPETRGRQSLPRIDWMLTDHLSMHISDTVSANNLFDTYRRWIIADTPYDNVVAELVSIDASANFFKRVIDRDSIDCLGRFGLFSDAFDVSTTMPLVLFLAMNSTGDDELGAALDLLKGFILRRDICRLTTKNYNKFFTDGIKKISTEKGELVPSLRKQLEAGVNETTTWPDNQTFGQGWMTEKQYRVGRQKRLVYILSEIEKSIRSKFSEEIEIKSELTLEHIMPQKWKENWGFESVSDDPDGENYLDYLAKEAKREGYVNRIGNLTLLTQKLNSSVSNGSFEKKMPAILAQSSLTLNRQLQDFDAWDEDEIINRAKKLYKIAAELWAGPSVNIPD